MTGLADPLDLDQVQIMARGLFPAHVSVAAIAVSSSVPDPWPEELACLSPRAIDKRRREFAAGRAAARVAMAASGMVPAAVGMAPDRSPVWPKGVTGGITHTRNCALAALGSELALGGIGIDVEERTPLKAQLVSEICTDAERTWLSGRPESHILAKLIFCAKEAAYKCQFPVSRKVFGFDVLDTDFNMENNRFTARFTRDVKPFSAGDRIDGHFAEGAGLILTGATLPPVG
jgi:4'-phosphopantetheinyl transferase EntD